MYLNDGAIRGPSDAAALTLSGDGLCCMVQWWVDVGDCGPANEACGPLESSDLLASWLERNVTRLQPASGYWWSV